jgi:carbon-monoxide dehydrogenase medium subunit
VKPAPFSYHCPRTLGEALHLLATLDNARILAGGQSLVPMLNFRLAAPDHVIDLGGIAVLAGIEETPEGLVVGAMTSQRLIERSPLVRRRCPLLSEAVSHVGHQQTRNRGTIGGSLCHLDPAAELPVAAAALDATLEATSSTGTRRLPFREFPAGYLTSRLRPEEILTRVEFPAFDPGAGWAFVEFNRRPADFAIVSVAVMLVTDATGKVSQARIAIGGLGPAPRRIGAAEIRLIGQNWNAALGDEVAAIAAASPAEGDALYPEDYRQHLAGVLTRRALDKAFARTRSSADA